MGDNRSSYQPLETGRRLCRYAVSQETCLLFRPKVHESLDVSEMQIPYYGIPVFLCCIDSASDFRCGFFCYACEMKVRGTFISFG